MLEEQLISRLEIIQTKTSKPHRSFEDRFAEQFGVSPSESDRHFDFKELDWGSPQGAEEW